MTGPYIHDIDPIFGQVGGFYLWWYGLSYTLGFLGLFLWLRRVRERLALTTEAVYGITTLMAAGVLLGGRLIEVIFYEWSYYGEHPWHIPAIWLGGMSTHGILLGAIVGMGLACRRYRIDFMALADELSIAGAYIMGVGRIGNFIDGQIAGGVTDVCWAVQFPGLDGFRHPVVLYDGLKNLLLIPVLLLLRRSAPPRGALFAHFVLWYGFLRIFVDLFREYRTASFLGFPPGQEFNVAMTVIGGVLLLWAYRRRGASNAVKDGRSASPLSTGRLWTRRTLLAALLVIPMIMPSDWTQDVPEQYGKRHPGLEHSIIYPQIGPAAAS